MARAPASPLLPQQCAALGTVVEEKSSKGLGGACNAEENAKQVQQIPPD